MLKNHIRDLLLTNLQHNPTSGQAELIDLLADFFISAEIGEIFLIKGYAGTGKTTLVNTMVKTLKLLNQKSILLAPTGRAAKVLSTYTKRNAYTIHKKIYRQKSSSDGFGEFTLNVNLHKDTFFIVDEASMISNSSDYSIFGSGRVLSDLLEYVDNGTNCKLILLGDTAQLPPVNLDISPALDKDYLEMLGLTVKSYEIKDVVRQAKDSGILHNATSIREQIGERDSYIPKLNLDSFEDIHLINGEDLIESIERSYDLTGMDETIVVCRSNKRANIFNQGIRNKILWKEEELSRGDYLMVVKNNYTYVPEGGRIDFIANGDIAEVIRIHSYQEEYGFRFADVTLRLIDYDTEMEAKLMLDTLYVDGPSLSSEDSKKLYAAVQEDYMDITNKQKRYKQLKEDKFLNALQVKFSYAVTCHKSQGGQWKHVYIDPGYFTEDNMNVEYLRWLYTAFTRSTEQLFLVNFNEKFFNSID